MYKTLHAIIVGPPGAGKGTIAARIVKSFGLKHLSSGDLLRQHMSQDTVVGKQAKGFIEKGQLVPDNIMQQLILNELSEQKPEASWLLDGFPRTQPQAEALVAVERVDVVINLDVPFQTIIERVQGRLVHIASGRVYNTSYNPPKVPGVDDVTGEPLVLRPDDRPEAVLERLKQYEALTKPVLNIFQQKQLLKTFHGTESDKIWPQVMQYIQDL